MPRGRGRLREEGEEDDFAPQLPPSAVVAQPVAFEELDEDQQKERDLAYLLGEDDNVPDSDASEGEDIFDEELLKKYVRVIPPHLPLFHHT